MRRMALQADSWYNKGVNIVCQSGARNTPWREMNLIGGSPMDTLSPKSPQRKPYVYFLRYPESMSGVIFYIGKGVGQRINVHETEARSLNTRMKNPHKVYVIRKIWKRGEQLLKEKIAHFDTDNEAYLYEFALVFFMQGYGNLTNITNEGIGGTTGLGYPKGRKKGPHTQEWKQRTSERLMGHVTSEETRQRISQSTKGRKHSEESIQKRIEALQGRPQSEEAKRKNSEAHKGKSPSEEHRRHLSEANKGKVYSEERKRNMSEGRKRAREQRNLWQSGNP